MERTGNHWITPYGVLTEAGIDVYLVNARHVKGVPGKKTVVCDAQWLQVSPLSLRPCLGRFPLQP